MAEYNERYEERASQLIADRNALVKQGRDPDSKYVNSLEERAANWLSRAKHGLPNE